MLLMFATRRKKQDTKAIHFIRTYFDVPHMHNFIHREHTLIAVSFRTLFFAKNPPNQTNQPKNTHRNHHCVPFYLQQSVGELGAR